ncbi:hypothetical protein GIS00_15055 [Nakamurella sp. YIM 132087]|uniref:Uncharacterized protein n=1 Tax=Nakamurella alba TaxID=2665158 RepID=A0A7K1FPI6_9ACTN|nr:hypothetical protein [Nakamurella alba]MTD15259.1 hypothetical protein [Nakamurella alba]
MTSTRARIILQAHATRTATALALLLHGRDRGPRDLRKPLGAVIGSVIIAVVIVIAVAVGTRVGAMLDAR